MSEDQIVSHDGSTDTTVTVGVDGDGKVAVDHGTGTLSDAVKAVAGALQGVRLLPLNPDSTQLRVFDGSWPNARQLLALRVEDGRLVAEYDPADLTEAAQQFVDAARKQWIAEMDDTLRFTADLVAEVLADAARAGGDPAGETISVRRAADVAATLLWGGGR